MQNCYLFTPTQNKELAQKRQTTFCFCSPVLCSVLLSNLKFNPVFT